LRYEQILVDRRDSVLVLTLNRPDRLNAWTPRMMAELTAAITAAEADPGLGAVVVTGAGRGFCAGADIGGEFASKLDQRGAAADGESSTGATGAQPEPPPAAGWVRFCRSTLPLVAAINGPAVGIGLTMVLPFDRLVAGRGAKLSARFVKMGLVPELASSHFLVARCGWGAASWLALSGTTIQGEEALALGLVDRVVDDGDVLDAAIAHAAVLAANPAPQLRMIKDLLTVNAAELDLDAVQRRELAALEVCYRTPEHREAVQAFLEKRPPDFASLGSPASGATS
jgi:enoyl-CoA hydratase/carnithine racemase